MIVYNKLDKLLADRGISKNQLGRETGLSTNIIAKISKNQCLKTETINRICEVLRVQPGEIMEWIPDEKWEESEKSALESQIAELQKKLDSM